MITIRMWHKSLVDVLPREQLVAQWREASSIAGNILKKGTPNHILVNRIIDYPFDHFITYVAAVRKEMTRRGYRTMDKVWEKIISITDSYNILSIDEVFNEWMDDEYFIICYYNLKEKWICGGIRDEDWKKIKEKREELGIDELYG